MDFDSYPPCHCCTGETVLFGRAKVLGKYPVSYYRCSACGFIQTEAPFWLPESYANPMTSYDLGGISRPTLNSRATVAVLNGCFQAAGRFLDFGGGYGVFTRWMRDLGYDFWHFDKHCANLFANGFAADLTDGSRYELATAFEVFEHFADPFAMLESILRVTDSVLFTTDLVPEPAPSLHEWTYFGPEHGQHVSFYTPAALRKLAARFGAHFMTGHGGFHLITRREISEERFRLVLGRRAQMLMNLFFRRRTLLWDDFGAAMKRAREAAPSTLESD